MNRNSRLNQIDTPPWPKWLHRAPANLARETWLQARRSLNREVPLSTSASIALPATLLLGLLGAATSTEAQTPVGSPGVIVATGESVIKVAPDQAW